jgi:thiol:disulfide interchange protein
MIRLLCYSFISILAFTGCKTTTKVEANKVGLGFVDSGTLSKAIEQATQEKKLIFVDIYTDWCLPCKMMDTDVFTDKNIIAFFEKHFVSLKVDAEKGNGPNLAYLYQVDSYPTLLFLDTKGRVLQKKVGAAYHTELMHLTNMALSIENVNR